MSDETFKGDEAVPKSYIRKILMRFAEDEDVGAKERIRALEVLAALEKYTGAGSVNLRDEQKKGVRIVQTSLHKIPPPKIAPGMARKKV